jgi:hypothetical protein
VQSSKGKRPFLAAQGWKRPVGSQSLVGDIPAEKVGGEAGLRYQANMNPKHVWQAFALHALVFCLFAGCSQKEESAQPARTGRDVIDTMRLKQLTKALQLTQEQQDKVKPLLAAESKQIEAVKADAALSIDDRSKRYQELRDDTYAKIRALLAPEQIPQLDQFLVQANKKRK